MREVSVNVHRFWKETAGPAADGLLKAYAEVFFSDSRVFAVVLLVVTFFDWPLGVSGLLSVVVAHGVAALMGFDKNQIRHGYFGFNALLTGLGLAMYYEFGFVLIVVVVVAALLSLFLSIGIKAFLGNYGLPFLSLPFILALWIMLLAGRDFGYLGLSQRGIYTLNTIYARGGIHLIDFYQWFENLPLAISLRIYLKSIAAIFFQQSIFAGILIALGLLWFSRIAFSLSFIGFYAAYFFYKFLGVDFNTLTYTYIGFNYILASVAIGGYFLIPSKTTYFWVVLIIPLLAVLTISLSKVFAVWNLSIYSLSFNLVVLLFLYVLKLRNVPGKKPVEVLIQNNSPEKNLYGWKNEVQRFGNKTFVAVKLPFWGAWSVAQGHNGAYTHRDEWQHAWDFVILNSRGKQFKNDGLSREDYFCYGKSVIAPAEGSVVQVINHVEDNAIGDVNTVENWGNTVVIKHNDYLYSILSHLQKGSVAVVEGQSVKFGTVVGKCGNSGRSAYPHLHFQLQATPFVGSKTLFHPIAGYIVKRENQQVLELYEIPREGDIVENIKPDDLLSQAFHFIPGQRFSWLDEQGNPVAEWEVMTSVYNKSYFFCKETESTAWFENDGALFYFTHFDGDRNSLLYHFYRAAFMVQLSYRHAMEIRDDFPVNKIFQPAELILQDFVAPFFFYKKALFRLKYAHIDNASFPSEITLESEVHKQNMRHKERDAGYSLQIDSRGIWKFSGKTKTKHFHVICSKP